MARKIFYMVRHGESLLNAAHIRQGWEGSLSPKGIEQAISTGKRLAKHKFGAVLVSPYVRTKETAENICAQIQKKVPPMEFVDLLTERRNPTDIVGESADDPKVKQIVDLIDRSFHKDDYRYSDEENFLDLKERARKLLVYLAHRSEKEILVVTHSIFLKMVASFVLYRDRLTADKYNLLSYHNASNNASISIFEYNSGWLGDGWLGRKFYPISERWKLLAWDDFTVEGTKV
ncbi:MAG: histidine phosphatase family protein [Candidatus Pacebacteria bacterium]|nr:histidine phosphatase family protein [Candidatus Paceibacterota bacterium]